MQTIGIYVGAFDPIHEGHLNFAYEATVQCGLDRVFFLVEPRPHKKQGVKALEHRLRMTQLAIENEPKFGSIAVEQRHTTLIEMLPILKARFGNAELQIMIGDDGLDRLLSWPNVERLIKSTNLIIGLRNHTEAEVHEIVQNIKKARGLKLRYSIFTPPESGLTSHDIRLALKRGERPEGMLPSVRSYIAQHGLYSSLSGSK